MATVAGLAWEPRYERAWRAAFALVVGEMLEGAKAATLREAA